LERISKMKILQISHRIPYPLNEGGTIGIYNYTKGFSEQGCEVTLFALAPLKHSLPEKEVREALEPYCELEIFPIDTTVKVFPALANLFQSRSYNVERFYSQEFEQALIEKLKSVAFDIIQIEGTYASPYSELALKYGNCPVVLRQHNVEYQIWERRAYNEANPLKKVYFSLLARRLKTYEANHLNQYAAIVPVTEDDGQLFKKLGCTSPIFSSPAGIDIQYWRPRQSAIKEQSFYHLGSLEWGPNLDAVTWFNSEVWPKIIAQFPQSAFYVAGKGMPQSLKNQSLTNVHMLGEIDDAAEFSTDKFCCIVPLRSGSGIRLKILEAMSAGKVVLSTSIGAQGIAYTNGVNILIADTPEEFVECITRLAEDANLVNELQRNARKLIVDHYSNQSVVKRLLDFYRELTLKWELTGQLDSKS